MKRRMTREREREETSFAVIFTRYIYEESTSNGFDALGRTRTCLEVRVHTRAWGDPSYARVFGASADARRRLHTISRTLWRREDGETRRRVMENDEEKKEREEEEEEEEDWCGGRTRAARA